MNKMAAALASIVVLAVAVGLLLSRSSPKDALGKEEADAHEAIRSAPPAQ